MYHPKLLSQFPIISDQINRPALGVVLRELEKVITAGVAGDIAEFGCYIGTTTLFMRRLLDVLGQAGERQLYAYDSFAGLPEKVVADRSAAGVDFKAGELRVSKKQFLREFQKANLTPPITHKAWFKDLRPEQLPSEIAFAFLDGDFYASIIDSLRLTWARLSDGGVITIDDYDKETLPGVASAVHDFFRDKPISIHHEHNIAILKRA